jgi:hypothetical protein
MDNDVQVGVLMPTGTAQLAGADPAELMNFAAAAEDLGFDSLWVNDSLLSARVEALTMLAALAPATDRVLLGGRAAAGPAPAGPGRSGPGLDSPAVRRPARRRRRRRLPRPVRAAALRAVRGALDPPVRPAR